MLFASLSTLYLLWFIHPINSGKYIYLLNSYHVILDRSSNEDQLAFGGIPKNPWMDGAPGWRSRLSVRLQPGHNLAIREFEPRVRLWADGSEPGACF